MQVEVIASQSTALEQIDLKFVEENEVLPDFKILHERTSENMLVTNLLDAELWSFAHIGFKAIVVYARKGIHRIQIKKTDGPAFHLKFFMNGDAAIDILNGHVP